MLSAVDSVFSVWDKKREFVIREQEMFNDEKIFNFVLRAKMTCADKEETGRADPFYYSEKPVKNCA